MAEEIVQINEHEVESRIRDFSKLLESITNLGDKKKELWLQIYENAIADRQNSYVMFKKLVDLVDNASSLTKSTEHAVHGKTISTYIERMSRANDQLIKLAELIADAEKKSEEISPDEMYERLSS